VVLLISYSQLKKAGEIIMPVIASRRNDFFGIWHKKKLSISYVTPEQIFSAQFERNRKEL